MPGELSTEPKIGVAPAVGRPQRGLMTRIRAHQLVLGMSTCVVVAGCMPLPASTGDLDMRSECAYVTAQPAMVGPKVVMKVAASNCHDPVESAPREQPIDRVARAVWESLETPVDAIEVTLTGTDPATATTITRADLSKRFGPGPRGIVVPVHDPKPSDALWLLLPFAFIAYGIAMFALARHNRRNGVMIVFFRG